MKILRLSISFVTLAMVLIGLITLTAPTGSAVGKPGTNWYVAANERGTGTGTSRRNAAFWRNVDSLNLQPGDTVHFLTDVEYQPVTSTGVTITKSGTRDLPIKFRGVGSTNNIPVCATLSSDRTAPYVSPDNGGETGADIFRIASGANNLIFDNICARNAQNMFYITADMVNTDASGEPIVNITSIDATGLVRIDDEKPHPLTIRNVQATNIRRFMDMSKTAHIINGKFSNINVKGFSKNAFRFYGSSSNLLQDIDLDGEMQTGDHFQAGIVFQGDTPDLANKNNLIRRATIKNLFEATSSSAYSQGDAVSDEEYDVGTRIETSNFSNLGDGGFDSKGADDWIVDTTITRAKRSVRHHPGSTPDSPLTVLRVNSVTPVRMGGDGSNDHVWASGKINVINSTFASTNAGTRVFTAEQSKKSSGITYGYINVSQSTVTVSPETVITRREAGCTILLNDTQIIIVNPVVEEDN